MRFETAGAPHTGPSNTVTMMMLRVLVATIPGVLVSVLFFGMGVIINLIIATAVAVGAEALMLKWRNRPIQPTLMDLSAVVTGVLLALAMPPLAPWWLSAIGAGFAIVFAKHLYGGLGYNPFNPAMAGYAVLLVSFPIYMTAWPNSEADFGTLSQLWFILTGQLPADTSLDAVTQATPLDHIKTQMALTHTITEIRESSHVFSWLGGERWELINLAFLLGGLYLLVRGVIRWQIPFAMLASMAFVALIMHGYDSDLYATPQFHLFSGATMLGAFFVATDPVSACTTPRGRLFYGAGIGVLVYAIRTFGGYPDGVAFSVLLMNMAAPTIDRYTAPRVYGHGESE
ncbi:MAG: electron transport complex subunit RsxD [Pseudomonadota bacterium]|nr:electron transport complex subunit RsxD [Pseudomonadota bacterium]